MPVAPMKRYVVTVPANDSIPVHNIGRYCFVETGATGTEVTVRVLSRSGALIADDMPIVTGASYDWGESSDRAVFKNSTGGNIEIVVWLGDGLGTLNLQSSTVSMDAHATYDSSADVTLADASSHDIAADGSRRELILEGDATNTGDLRIRDQGGTTSEGKKLKPGESVFLGTRGAVRIRNNSGAPQTFAIAVNKA